MVILLIRIDWVFIDTIIIFLLFLLLLSVRIFKSTHRWRSSFSNEALEHHTFPKTNKHVKSQFIKIKQWRLTKNSSVQKEKSNRPLILILRTNYKKKLNKIITEGLGSYGFNTLNLKVKITNELNSKQVGETIKDEMKSSISMILDLIKQKELIENSKYFLLNYSKFLAPASAVLSDSKNIGLILINPKITKKNIENFKEIFAYSEKFNQPYYIFSRRNFFFMKNKRFKHFNAEFKYADSYKGNVSTLDKSNKNFKYYETILLGIIIDILENKVLNP